jgi:hypothetical protein
LEKKGLYRFDRFDIKTDGKEGDMSANVIGEKIFNAFDVVRDTYSSVEKLSGSIIKYTKENKDNKYTCITDFFLREDTKNKLINWAYSIFTMVFEKDSEPESLYVLMIDLFPKYSVYGGEEYKEPVISIMKYTYRNTDGIPDCHFKDELLKQSAYSAIGNPVMEMDEKIVEYTENASSEGKAYTLTVTKDGEEHSDENWLGLRTIKAIDYPLVEITGENIYDRIFRVFDKL